MRSNDIDNFLEQAKSSLERIKKDEMINLTKQGSPQTDIKYIKCLFDTASKKTSDMSKKGNLCVMEEDNPSGKELTLSPAKLYKGLDGKVIDRRTHALLSTLEDDTKRYKEKYPDIDIKRILIDMDVEICTTPNILDAIYGLCPAVALWLADEAFLEGYEDDLAYLLEKNHIPESDPDRYVFKTNMSPSVFMRLITLLYRRNLAGKKRQEEKNPLFADKYAAERTKANKGNPKETYFYRDILNELMSWIPEERIKQAEEAFLTALGAHSEGYIDLMAQAKKTEIKTLEKALRITYDAKTEYEKIRKQAKDAMSKIESAKGPSLDMVKMLPSFPIMQTAGSIYGPMNVFPYDRVKNAGYEVYNAHMRYETLSKRLFCRNDLKLTQKPIENLDETTSNKIRELWNAIEIHNPLDCIFGYFSLLDKGEDIAWKFGVIAPVLEKAASHLPWATKCEITDSKDVANQEHQETTKNVYALKYGENNEYNLAQIIYQKTGIVLSHRLYVEQENIDDTLNKGVGEEATTVLQLINNFANNVKRTAFNDHDDELPETDDQCQEQPPEEESEEKNEDYQETEEYYKAILQKQKQDIEKLKKQAYLAHREVLEEKEKLENANREKELQRKELADLRELVFSLQKGNYDEPCEENEEKIEFPYETEGRIVVFGGHDTWSKAIRPMLPSVRFYDKYTKPNEAVIKYADEIWIQTNALSHSSFYNIMNIARKEKKLVRYFRTASAELCARQLVMSIQNKY